MRSRGKIKSQRAKRRLTQYVTGYGAKKANPFSGPGGVIHALDLFSGIGGISLALRPWARTVAYCEQDPYCQAVLLERMQEGKLDMAPIWPDVRTLRGKDIPIPVDLISGGFPCQDISLAGHGAGLAGERSGLAFEVLRLVQEIRPTFVFLENVPAITRRGGIVLVRALAQMGYDTRWGLLSARTVGAWHRRERWWLLAHAIGAGLPSQPSAAAKGSSVHAGNRREALAHTKSLGWGERGATATKQRGIPGPPGGGAPVAHAHGIPPVGASKPRQEFGDRPTQPGLGGGVDGVSQELDAGYGENLQGALPDCLGPGKNPLQKIQRRWRNGTWERGLTRTVTCLPHRGRRVRALGNSVVPQCAREAFRLLLPGQNLSSPQARHQ